MKKTKIRKVPTTKVTKTKPKAKTAKFKGVTHINVILDASGSMMSIRPEVISGFNTYINELKKDKAGECRVTLTQFSSKSSVIFSNKLLEEVEPLTETTYVPNGFTALFDAISQTANTMKSTVDANDRVLNVIITDGQENASKEVTKAEEIRGMIKALEDAGNWTFTYLSAAATAFTDSNSIGVAKGNVMKFSANPAATSKAFRSMSNSTGAYRLSANKIIGSFYSGVKSSGDKS